MKVFVVLFFFHYVGSQPAPKLLALPKLSSAKKSIFLPLPKKSGFARAAECTYNDKTYKENEEYDYFVSDVNVEPYYGFRLQCVGGKTTVIGCYENKLLIKLDAKDKSVVNQGFSAICTKTGLDYERDAQDLCKGHPVGESFNEGFYRYLCTEDRGPKVTDCLDLNENVIKIGEEYTAAGVYQMKCIQKPNGIAVEAVCTDTKGTKGFVDSLFIAGLLVDCLDNGKKIGIGESTRVNDYMKTCLEKRDENGFQTAVALNLTKCCEPNSDKCNALETVEPSVVMPEYKFHCTNDDGTYNSYYTFDDVRVTLPPNTTTSVSTTSLSTTQTVVSTTLASTTQTVLSTTHQTEPSTSKQTSATISTVFSTLLTTTNNQASSTTITNVSPSSISSSKSSPSSATPISKATTHPNFSSSSTVTGTTLDVSSTTAEKKNVSTSSISSPITSSTDTSNSHPTTQPNFTSASTVTRTGTVFSSTIAEKSSTAIHSGSTVSNVASSPILTSSTDHLSTVHPTLTSNAIATTVSNIYSSTSAITGSKTVANVSEVSKSSTKQSPSTLQSLFTQHSSIEPTSPAESLATGTGFTSIPNTTVHSSIVSSIFHSSISAASQLSREFSKTTEKISSSLNQTSVSAGSSRSTVADLLPEEENATSTFINNTTTTSPHTGFTNESSTKSSELPSSSDGTLSNTTHSSTNTESSINGSTFSFLKTSPFNLNVTTTPLTHSPSLNQSTTSISSNITDHTKETNATTNSAPAQNSTISLFTSVNETSVTVQSGNETSVSVSSGNETSVTVPSFNETVSSTTISSTNSAATQHSTVSPFNSINATSVTVFSANGSSSTNVIFSSTAAKNLTTSIYTLENVTSYENINSTVHSTVFDTSTISSSNEWDENATTVIGNATNAKSTIPNTSQTVVNNQSSIQAFYNETTTYSNVTAAQTNFTTIFLSTFSSSNVSSTEASTPTVNVSAFVLSTVSVANASTSETNLSSTVSLLEFNHTLLTSRLAQNFSSFPPIKENYTTSELFNKSTIVNIQSDSSTVPTWTSESSRPSNVSASSEPFDFAIGLSRNVSQPTATPTYEPYDVALDGRQRNVSNSSFVPPESLTSFDFALGLTKNLSESTTPSSSEPFDFAIGRSRNVSQSSSSSSGADFDLALGLTRNSANVENESNTVSSAVLTKADLRKDALENLILLQNSTVAPTERLITTSTSITTTSCEVKYFYIYIYPTSIPTTAAATTTTVSTKSEQLVKYIYVYPTQGEPSTVPTPTVNNVEAATSENIKYVYLYVYPSTISAEPSTTTTLASRPPTTTGAPIKYVYFYVYPTTTEPLPTPLPFTTITEAPKVVNVIKYYYVTDSPTGQPESPYSSRPLSGLQEKVVYVNGRPPTGDTVPQNKTVYVYLSEKPVVTVTVQKVTTITVRVAEEVSKSFSLESPQTTVYGYAVDSQFPSFVSDQIRQIQSTLVDIIIKHITEYISNQPKISELQNVTILVNSEPGKPLEPEQVDYRLLKELIGQTVPGQVFTKVYKPFDVQTVGSRCRQGWVSYRSKCYLVSAPTVRNTREAAEQFCQGEGGELLVIESMDEWEFLKSYLSTIQEAYPSKAFDGFWIGLYLDEKTNIWQWLHPTGIENIPWLPNPGNIRGRSGPSLAVRGCGEVRFDTTEWGVDKDHCMHREEFICSMTLSENLFNARTEYDDITARLHCVNDWTKYDKHCYFFSKRESRLDKISAENVCGNENGYLLVLNDNNEKDFVLKEVDRRRSSLPDAGQDGYWIGLQRDPSSSAWSWIRPSNLSSFDWLPENSQKMWDLIEESKSDPNRQVICGELRLGDKKWGFDKDHCLHQEAYICEKDLSAVPGDCAMWQYYCPKTADCVKFDGSNRCVCKAGFEGDGYTCIKV